MIEPEERPDNLGPLNIGGVSTSKMGVPFPIHCPKCREMLTAVLLNQKCTVDIRVECSACGGVAEGRNMWGQIRGQGEIKDGRMA